MIRTAQESADYQQAAEFSRLTQSKMDEHNLAVIAINHVLVFFIFSICNQELYLAKSLGRNRAVIAD